MARVMINESTLTSIANAIRSKLHASDTYKPHEMPLAIESISTGITPIGNINITTMSSTDVTNYATAQVVDSDLVAGNIKSGVDILGVVGEYTGLVPTGNINITDTNTTNVTNYATAKVVDADLVEGNIKSGVNILGVTGNYSGLVPSGNKNITDTSTTDVTNYATAKVVDSDLVASNIKKDVNILGVVGTYDAGSGGSVIQYSPVMTQVKNKTSYTTTNSKITVAQSGTYKCSWVNFAYAAGSSSTYATQLYKNNSAVGSVHNAPAYSGTSSFVATENSISLNAGDTIEVRARTRSGSNYYTTAGMLVIEKL